MTQKIRKKLPHWLYAAIVFALMVLAVFFPLVQGKIPFPAYVVNFFPAWTGVTASTAEYPVANIGDLVTQFYPYRSLAANSVRHGTLPLWNPYILSGVTFIGNCHSAMFYLPNFIYYLLPLPAAWAFALIFRLFLGAMFMWLFLKSIGTTPAASILGTIVFSCCGFMTIWQGQTMADSAIWLPVIFYAIHRLHLDMSWRSAALVAVSYAMPVLAGMPETALHETLAGTAWALLLWVIPTGKVRRPFDFRFLCVYMGSGILAMGLAAIQIIPTVEWLRELGHVLAATWPPTQRFQALTFVSRDILRNPNSAGLDIPEAAAYIGMASLLLAPLALFHGQRKFVAFFGAMVLISVGVVYGFEPFRWISLQIPIVKAIKNGRMILLASFGIATLAAMGLSTLERESAQEKEEAPHRRNVQLILVLLCFAFSYFLVYELWEMTVLRVEFTRRPSFSRALLFLSFIPIVLRLRGKFPRSLLPWAMCSIVAFDLVTFSHGAAGFSKSREVFPKAPVFEFLKQRESPLQYRMAEVGGPYPDNAQMVYGLSSGDGYELAMQRMVDFAAGYSVPTDGLHFEGPTYFMQNDRRMDMLNVKYLVAMTNGPESVEFGKRPDRYARIYNDSTVSVYENNRVLPRFIAIPISGMEVVEPAQQLVRMKDPSFDPERKVLVSETPPGVPTQTSSAPLESRVAVLDSGVNGYTLQTTASEPAIVVVSQTSYVGWKAIIDEKETPVFTANYALSGFFIPAGTHNVRFIFQPWSFKLGMIITGISLLIAIAMATRGKK